MSKYWMFRFQLCFGGFLLVCAAAAAEPIIADHTAVAQYDKIPQRYLDKVKAMWVSVAGESHSSGYRKGALLLQELDPRFVAKVRESGTPDGPTSAALRLSRATWGDLTNATGWRYGYGEEDWFTSSTSLLRTRASLDYAHSHGLPLAAFGFGWCWDMTADNSPGGGIDPVYQVRWAGRSYNGPQGSRRWGLDDGDTTLTGNTVSIDTYLAATESYIAHCRANGYPTLVFFTTGPVDGGGNTGENGYQRHLKHERIRDYVRAGSDRVLFDYADILCWSDAGTSKTVTWRDWGGTLQTFPYIHDDNMLDLAGGYAEDGDHIGQRGALRLAKALWWMLARQAGWDGLPEDLEPPAGSVAIDPGAAFTSSTAVRLTLAASDAGRGVDSMRLGEDGLNWGDWEPFDTGRDWALAAGDGLKTVWAQFRDGAGNLSVATSDTIHLDTAPPASRVTTPGGLTWPMTWPVGWTVEDPPAGGVAAGVRSVELYWRRFEGAWTRLGSYDPGVAEAVFNAALAGGAGRYEFYTVATDAAGNTEAAPTVPDATFWLQPAALGPEWRGYR